MKLKNQVSTLTEFLDAILEKATLPQTHTNFTYVTLVVLVSFSSNFFVGKFLQISVSFF